MAVVRWEPFRELAALQSEMSRWMNQMAGGAQGGNGGSSSTWLPALDAWETMLPTAQRMAELLDGVLLDDQRSALGRQRIAHIRDELRAYDRQREAPPPIRPNRW